MKGDFTRFTFDRRAHYSGVRQQQGRVTLDADWNEQLDIASYRTETECVDTVGASGMPIGQDGLRAVASAAALTAAEAARPGNQAPPALLGPGDFLITAGRGYVGGWLVENERITRYLAQPDLPGLAAPLAGIHIAYLDVWQRHVSTLELPGLQAVEPGLPDIREVALGGPDTTTRQRTVWQLRLLRVGDIGAALDCTSVPAAWTALTTPPSGRLAARALPSAAPTGPCVLPADAGYRRLENQLYRVEVHGAGPRGTATFKWSRDNGTVVARWETQAGADITVSSAGRDKLLSFAPGQWVELLDDARELRGEHGTLVQLSAVNGNRLTLDLPSAGADPTTLAAFGANPRVRRWDSAGTLRPTNDGWLDLEDGVQVRMTVGDFRTGDHWVIPARTAITDVEWPLNGAVPAELAPRGTQHRFSRVAMMHFDGATWTQIDDCRLLFPPLTLLTSFHYVSGDGQEAAPPDPTLANALVPLPQALRAGVSNGGVPVVGARVRFRVLSGAGRVGGAGAEVTVLTDAAGVAATTWDIGWNRLAPVASQQVEARLLDAGGQPLHLPLVYNANLSLAARVAYVPGDCDHLQQTTNVQQALDALCALRSFFYLSGDGQEAMADLAQPALPVPLAQPLRVGVARGPTPVAGARVAFTVVAGAGQLNGGPGPVVVSTGADGTAAVNWALSAGAAQHVVQARLLDAAANPVQLPVHFNASLSQASAVAYDPGNCAALAGEFTVQDAIHRLCQLLGTARPGIQVRRVLLLGGGEFQNDVVITPDDLRRGLGFNCDQPLARDSVDAKPVVELAVQLPLQLAVGTAVPPGPVEVALLLEGQVSLINSSLVAWTPRPALLAWLERQLELLGQLDRPRLLVRVRLLGRFIWAEDDRTLHVDGQLFGTPNNGVPRPRSFADFPSGNGAGGSNLEMWFWIGRSRETGVEPPFGPVGPVGPVVPVVPVVPVGPVVPVRPVNPVDAAAPVNPTGAKAPSKRSGARAVAPGTAKARPGRRG
jgi:hypothetical protein